MLSLCHTLNIEGDRQNVSLTWAMFHREPVDVISVIAFFCVALRGCWQGCSEDSLALGTQKGLKDCSWASAGGLLNIPDYPGLHTEAKFHNSQKERQMADLYS